MAKGHGIISLWVAAGLSLAGCAGAGDRYPSLGVRDAERAVGAPAPTPPVDPAPTYSVDRAEIGDALERARSANERFLAQADGARGLILSAAGQGPDSDRRSRALIALADLTSLRSATAIALADLDRLEAEAAMLFAPTQDIRTAQQYVARLMGEQDATIDSLSEVMGL
jgi:hypothetical protein